MSRCIRLTQLLRLCGMETLTTYIHGEVGVDFGVWTTRPAGCSQIVVNVPNSTGAQAV